MCVYQVRLEALHSWLLCLLSLNSSSAFLPAFTSSSLRRLTGLQPWKKAAAVAVAMATTLRLSVSCQGLWSLSGLLCSGVPVTTTPRQSLLGKGKAKAGILCTDCSLLKGKRGEDQLLVQGGFHPSSTPTAHLFCSREPAFNLFCSPLALRDRVWLQNGRMVTSPQHRLHAAGKPHPPPK